MNFVPDQPSGSVSVSESTLHSQPMLEYTRAQVTGHAGIEDAPSDVGEDVDKEEAATWHDATVLCQAQRGGKSAAVQSVAGSLIASERSERSDPPATRSMTELKPSAAPAEGRILS